MLWKALCWYLCRETDWLTDEEEAGNSDRTTESSAEWRRSSQIGDRESAEAWDSGTVEWTREKRHLLTC